ncbi:MAG: outer membrane beta-barrel protein [Flavobacterium sp.]|nr:outer membrane beta-barrel protein [Flavobacterium sp.]
MKKFITTLCFACFATFYASAQQETRLGGFLAFGSEIESAGFGVNAEFPIMDKLTIAPGFIYYLPNDHTYVKTTIFEINGNANYYFMEHEIFGFYGLAGINYTSVKVKVDDFGFGIGGASSSEGKIGLNIGGGTNFNLGKKWLPFAEIKYVVSDYDQLVLLAGVKFNL